MRVFLSAVAAMVVISIAANLLLPRLAGESSEAAYSERSARP